MTLHTNSGSPSSHWTANVKTLNENVDNLLVSRKFLEETVDRLREQNAELQKKCEALDKLTDDYREISTCVNQYRYMKRNKHLFNREQQSATWEEIVDKLLKCVAE